MEPLADWEREYLESPARQRQTEAVILRYAADILLERARRETFTLRVIVKVLRNTADRLEPHAWPAEPAAVRPDHHRDHRGDPGPPRPPVTC